MFPQKKLALLSFIFFTIPQAADAIAVPSTAQPIFRRIHALRELLSRYVHNARKSTVGQHMLDNHSLSVGSMVVLVTIFVAYYAMKTNTEPSDGLPIVTADNDVDSLKNPPATTYAMITNTEPSDDLPGVTDDDVDFLNNTSATTKFFTGNSKSSPEGSMRVLSDDEIARRNEVQSHHVAINNAPELPPHPQPRNNGYGAAKNLPRYQVDVSGQESNATAPAREAVFDQNTLGRRLRNALKQPLIAIYNAAAGSPNSVVEIGDHLDANPMDPIDADSESEV